MTCQRNTSQMYTIRYPIKMYVRWSGSLICMFSKGRQHVQVSP